MPHKNCIGFSMSPIMRHCLDNPKMASQIEFSKGSIPDTGMLTTRCILAKILVLAGTTGAGVIQLPTSTRISARMKDQ